MSVGADSLPTGGAVVRVDVPLMNRAPSADESERCGVELRAAEARGAAEELLHVVVRARLRGLEEDLVDLEINRQIPVVTPDCAPTAESTFARRRVLFGLQRCESIEEVLDAREL